MTEPPPAGLLLAAAIAALIGIVVWLAARGQGQDQALAAEVDQGVVADYLRYPEAPERQRVAHEHLVAHDADGAWRIEGTYHETAAGSLDFLLW